MNPNKRVEKVLFQFIVAFDILLVLFLLLYACGQEKWENLPQFFLQEGLLCFVPVVPVVEQSGFLEDIKYWHNRDKECGCICNICHGKLITRNCRSIHVLSSPQNISFTWNTDGVPVFKSSNSPLWPLYLVVNELPPKKCFSKDDINDSSRIVVWLLKACYVDLP